MQIDIDELEQLVVQSDQIFLTPKGEKVLIKLLEIQKQVENAIEAAKKKLETAALRANPNFTSIQADKIKVYYRAYGPRYYIDESQINMAPKELYTTEEKIVYKVDPKAVDRWVNKYGGMPVGIREVEREKKLTFILKEGAENEQP